MRVAVTVVMRKYSPAVARCSQMIARGLAAADCQSELIVAGNWVMNNICHDEPFRFTCFAKTAEQKGSQMRYLRYMRKNIRLRNWDTLLIYSVGLPFPLFISQARRKGIKVVYFQGDQWQNDPRMSLPHKIKIAAINAIDRYLARRADLIALGGTSLLRQHFERIAPDVNILEQWTPTDTAIFSQGDADAFRQSHKLESRKLIVYCGSIHSLEGVDVLIRAMPEIKKQRDDATLVLAGKLLTHDILLEKAIDFPALVESLGLHKEVLFTGLLGIEDMKNLLHAADVLVMPKINHRMNKVAAPIKLPEYLSSERPVVASRVGDIPKYLRDGCDALLCEPDDPHDLADKILKILDDPALAKRLGVNGASVAKHEMDHRVWAQRILKKIT